ncbi:MAG: HAD-IIIA family hydrolase [Deltaproteobacteria bacterium]|jgi:D-glycero-D-manno-heptose 1,7-bisphosphate phosphatase|nr:HAD-IIIA family hydrolase [Deltaproteobacteria bacterium]
MGKRAIFFDRDGVLCQAVVKEGKPYPPADAASLIVPPAATLLLPRLKTLGFFLFVVTNQPDVARGTRTKENVLAINEKLATLLPLDGFYVCFHDNQDNCPCRKPKPGLILKAAEENGIDLGASWLIGDRASDVEAGVRAGCLTIFLDFDYAEPKATRPNFVRTSLKAAIDLILEEESRGDAQ